MERRSACQTHLRANRTALWFCLVLLFSAGAGGMKSHPSSTLSVSAPHLFYTCPEGATAKLVCGQSGAALHQTDVLKRSWLFTPHADQHCSGKEGPRHTNVGGHSHGNHSLTPGLHFGSSEQNFWMVLQNVTLADQGRYCCLLLDFQVEHKHGVIVQKPHSHMILQVSPRRNGSQECTVWNNAPAGSLAPVVVAASACIIALFALPLILLLVYKQRQTHKSRRAQELVRMDSEAQGHENPVFFGESPQARTRTVSQIMTRQSSETGRHLLSEPGTPLSPPAHGDVFFPIEDTIPESPDLLQV
ncbi:V-type immunoglobulin domain-containing suppressor of T-cell activation isoform X1 [Labrus bergylta]|uniref:V-type immunoglobulin domain-containing suppressor of T-cell activation isoform X1 n=2 Tax=Labrus bergylta TaxID=56723 RepID=UPI0009B3EAC6|nr:V-type immunoglobulin domain-containing suppressor of T-cell activation isoform X1 [Labrus bergylta]